MTEVRQEQESQLARLSRSGLDWLASRRVAFVLAVLAVLSAVATYVALTYSFSPLGTPPTIIAALITLDILLLCALGAVLFRQLLGIVRTLHATSKAKLQTRMVVVFTLLALVPGVIVSLCAGYLFYFGIQSWFDTKVSTALEESVAVAEGYLSEHRQTIKSDILAMANDINRQAIPLRANPLLFNKFMNGQAALRGLTEAAVFQPGRILVRSSLTFAFAVEEVSQADLARADSGELVILNGSSRQGSVDIDDRVRALLKLDQFSNTYLLVGRFVDPDVINHMERTRGAVSEYRSLQQRITDLQWQFFAVFALLTLILLLAALWYGLNFAGALLKPISNLYQVAERIRAGDLSARVEEDGGDDEFAELGRAFNRMTTQLETQRSALVDANRQLDNRRRFIETVLTGVSAGVIALNAQQHVRLCNRSASELLGRDDDALQGTALRATLPEMADLLDKAAEQPDKQLQADITLEREGKPLTLHTRIEADMFDGQVEGYIVTFDDITPLVQAQRRAAWADVARRIAHEIKNPLTPIQLSAERLKRKYGRHMQGEDKELFSKYTDTIVRHVEDIGGMVDEFVSFARMPQPRFEPVDMTALVREVVFSETNRTPGIRYILRIPETALVWHCDRSQIGRALTNTLKNAEEALKESSDAPDKHIIITLEVKDRQCVVMVEDNGRGFPPELMAQLTEPYVTTRPKGTGLGLAIVRKILEDHKGSLQLDNGEDGGARVSMVLPERASDSGASQAKPKALESA